VLPEGLDGVELVIYARARSPELKSLFISGYSDPVMDDPDRDDFVTKPFRPRELLGCVYELLSRQRSKKRVLAPQREARRAIVEGKVASMQKQRQGAAKVARVERAGGQAAVGTGSILVVDDDPDVLDVAAMMIEDLGFTVHRAGDGAEALRVLEAHPNVILLVTDVVMPGMDGWELARAAKRHSSTLKVLYMSGFIKNQTSLPGEEYGPILSKPWRTRQFYEAVKQILVSS
jgi:CheY-like chemotaxis protein